MSASLIACSVALLTSVGLAQVPFARQVAAPPADIEDGVVVLPRVETVADRSRAVIVDCDFQERGGEWVFETPLTRNAGEELLIAPLGAWSHAWSLELSRDGQPVETLRDYVAQGKGTRWLDSVPAFGGVFPVEATRLASAAASEAGAWQLTVRTPRDENAPRPRGRILMSAAGGLEVVTHLSTWSLLADEPVGVCAWLEDPAERAQLGDLRPGGAEAEGRPLTGVASDVRLTVESPWGRQVLPMYDDGAHADGAPGDGKYGAFVPRGLSGNLTARATFRGTTPDGRAVFASGQQAFPVLEPALLLTGQVDARPEGGALQLDVGLELLAPARKLHLSTEVWARFGDGAPRPVAWLSKMVRPEGIDRNGVGRLGLALDARWLGSAGRGRAPAQLELRELRVQDPDTHVVLDRIDRLDLGLPRLPATAFEDPGPIVRDMLMGTAAPAPGARPRDAALPGTGGGSPGNGALMLVHGYCSGGNVWPDADFSDPKIQFLDPDQNRSHDEFAQLLLATGAGFDSYGVLGHSQGGAAALHLYTFYTSGLDSAQGDRLIQSVATPYQGTPLASLGGFSCGTNTDLTVSGAAAWLSGIPSWARQEVYYWTTVDAGSACSSLANLFLDFNDNDGTTERVRGQLTGATNMGHIPGWCHTTGMTFPANYTDSVRNVERDAAAAR